MEHQNHNALKTVGYKEVFDFYNGLYSKDEAISKIIVNTKKYAKRQMTWFKKDPDYIWVNNANTKESFEKIKTLISH
jgi:tRNA dimethylallyltransferase